MAILGGLCVAALALIGAGAAALWTTTTTSSQQIASGYLSVGLSGPGSCTATDAYGSCTSLALPAVGLVGSSFASTPQLITITNNGTVTATEITLTVGDTPGTAPAGPALASEVYMCLYSQSWVVYNGPLSGAEGSIGLYPTTLAPLGTDNYTAVFYAGADQVTGCGSYSGWQYGTGTPLVAGSTSTAPELLTAAENGSDTPFITVEYSG